MERKLFEECRAQGRAIGIAGDVLVERRGRIDRRQSQTVELQTVEHRAFGNRLKRALRIERADDCSTDRAGDAEVARSTVGAIHGQFGKVQQTSRYEQGRRPVRSRIQHRREHGSDQPEPDLADSLDAEAATRDRPNRATLVNRDGHGDRQRRKGTVGAADQYGVQWVSPRAAGRDPISSTQLRGQVRRGTHCQADAGDVEGSFGPRQRVAESAYQSAQPSDGHRQAWWQQERRTDVSDRAGVGVPAAAHLELQMVADRRQNH